jgi:hypothetical protein
VPPPAAVRDAGERRERAEDHEHVDEARVVRDHHVRLAEIELTRRRRQLELDDPERIGRAHEELHAEVQRVGRAIFGPRAGSQRDDR